MCTHMHTESSLIVHYTHTHIHTSLIGFVDEDFVFHSMCIKYAQATEIAH